MPRSLSVRSARLASGNPSTPANFWPLMEIVTSLCSCGVTDRNWFSKRRPDHLFAAARPTLIKARIRDKYRQVVSAAVASGKRTRWATPHIIPAYNPPLGHISKDAESAVFSFKRILADGLGFGSRL